MAAKPTTILCIDDDRETLEFRKQLLEMHGYTVITASSGAEGLRIFSEGHPADLVLLDYIMPGVTGAEVAEQLKQLSPSIPIVLMSAFPELPESLLRMVDGYVRKGQDPEVMIGAISNALTSGNRKV